MYSFQSMDIWIEVSSFSAYIGIHLHLFFLIKERLENLNIDCQCFISIRNIKSYWLLKYAVTRFSPLTSSTRTCQVRLLYFCLQSFLENFLNSGLQEWSDCHPLQISKLHIILSSKLIKFSASAIFAHTKNRNRISITFLP